MNELPEFGQIGFAGIKRVSVLNAGENREGRGGLGGGWRGQQGRGLWPGVLALSSGRGEPGEGFRQSDIIPIFLTNTCASPLAFKTRNHP